MRPIRVALIQHSTRSDNLGVGALTVSEIAILRRIAARLGRPVAITVMDWVDRRTPYVSGPDIRIVDLDGRAMVDPRGWWREARAADVVIDIGGGDSFADIYGKPRLRRMLWLKAVTHMAGTPLVVAPQTIGPFTQPRSRRLALATLRRSAIVATRDAFSTAAARKLGVDGAIIEASDVALRLPYDPPPPRPAGARPRVGLNVSGLLMAGGYGGANDFQLGVDYPTLVHEILDHFETHPDAPEVHLIPHVIVADGRMAKEDDYRASEALAAEHPGVILAPRFASPSEAKTYIAGLDFFAGARMHACVAAFSTGVAVVPMAYSRKFAGLFGTLGYDRTVDCRVDPASKILAHIADGYDQRATLAAEAKAALAKGLEKLDRYESALEALLRDVPA